MRSRSRNSGHGNLLEPEQPPGLLILSYSWLRSQLGIRGTRFRAERLRPRHDVNDFTRTRRRITGTAPSRGDRLRGSPGFRCPCGGAKAQLTILAAGNAEAAGTRVPLPSGLAYTILHLRDATTD